MFFYRQNHAYQQCYDSWHQTSFDDYVQLVMWCENSCKVHTSTFIALLSSSNNIVLHGCIVKGMSLPYCKRSCYLLSSRVSCCHYPSYYHLEYSMSMAHLHFLYYCHRQTTLCLRCLRHVMLVALSNFFIPSRVLSASNNLLLSRVSIWHYMNYYHMQYSNSTIP